ncbi:MAG TPA: hypothetical protein VFU11_06775 [Solirubrobacterales bacterium]|nr:hypothetical protein [Solirubrobacterales bacterium]
MDNDQTPINAQPKRRQPQAFEDLSLALRDRVFWPLGDRFLALSDGGRAAVAGGAVVLALAVGVGGYSLSSSGDSDPAPAAPVAVTSAPAPEPAPVKAEPRPEPEPTLQGAAPVFKAPEGEDEATASAKPTASEPTASASSASTGNAATDTISSRPGATATARPSTATESVDGPPAGPAAIAVARKFADAFVVYETGAEKAEVRQAFKATAVPEVTKALLQRPPRQPAGVEVPKAKVVNVVPAPSHDEIYPVSVSLLRVGTTSELRLEMEQLKNKDWRVINVLG